MCTAKRLLTAILIAIVLSPAFSFVIFAGDGLKGGSP